MRQGQLLKTYKVNFSTEGVSIATKGNTIIIGAAHVIYCRYCNKEFFRGSALSHQAIAGGPLLLASIGREQILDMLNKVPNNHLLAILNNSRIFSIVPRRC